MRGIEQEESRYQDIEWTADLEVHLLFAMVGLKPVGVHRSFHMLRIWEKFTSSINKNVSPKAIWKHLETMYDLATLDEAEGLQFSNEFQEFSLPGDEFDELISAKRKGTGNNTETDVNTDESSSDVALGSEIIGEVKESDEKIDTENVHEATEISDDSAKKKKLTLSLKKRRRNEDDSEDSGNISESAKRKRIEKVSESTADGDDDNSKDESGKMKAEDSDKESAVKSQTPASKDRKSAKNKKKKKKNMEVEDEQANLKEPSLSRAMSGSTESVLNIEKEVVPAEDKKKKSTPVKSKVSKIRRKASTDKSEEGTDFERGEEETRVTRKLDVSKNESVSSIVEGKENNTEKSVTESKKRTRKQEEESDKKNVKESESSSSLKRGGKVQKDDTKPVFPNQKKARGKDEVKVAKEEEIDSDEEVYAKKISVSSPAVKSNEKQDEDSDSRKSTQKDDRKKNKRDKIVNDELASNKKPRRGSLKTPQVSSLKSERRLSRGDDASKASSSDDMEVTKLSDNEKSSKKDSVSKADSKKVERTNIRSKVKIDASPAQAESEASQAGTTPSSKKDRQRDSLVSESSSSKRKSVSIPPSKRAGRNATTTPEPTPKRRRL